MSRLTIYACESQPIVSEGLQKVLGATEDLEFIGASATLTDALDGLRRLDPDILLIDQAAGLKVAFQFLSDVKNTAPRCQPVLWVQEMAEIDCFRALQMGARGIVRKTLPVEMLVDCLRSVAKGTIWIESSLSTEVVGFLNRKSAPRLTPREREITRYICVGLKNKEIAESLKITAGTVKVHLMHIFEKTGVKDRFELAVHGRRLLGDEPQSSMSTSSAQA